MAFHPGTLGCIIDKRCSVVNCTRLCHSRLNSADRSPGQDDINNRPSMTLVNEKDVMSIMYIDRRLEQYSIV